MAKTRQEDEYVRYKFALALSKLYNDYLVVAIDSNKRKLTKIDLPQSMDDISASCGLRKATISNALAGLSNIKATTLEVLLEIMGKSYTEFGGYLDKLSGKEIMDYQQKKEEERKKRKQKAGAKHRDIRRNHLSIAAENKTAKKAGNKSTTVKKKK